MNSTSDSSPLPHTSVIGAHRYDQTTPQTKQPDDLQGAEGNVKEAFKELSHADPSTNLNSAPGIEVKKQNEIANESCLRSLGKVSKFFLTSSAKIFKSLQPYVDKRKAEHQQLVKNEMAKYVEKTIEGLSKHREFNKEGSIKEASNTELLEVEEDLFLEPEDFKAKFKSHEAVAKLAVEKKCTWGSQSKGKEKILNKRVSQNKDRLKILK